MRIVVYTATQWALPAGFPPDGGDEVHVLDGRLDALSARVVPLSPDVLLVAGFSDDAALLMALERTGQALLHTTVLAVCTNPEPELLVRMMRAGVREVLSDDQTQWSEAIERARLRARPQPLNTPALLTATRTGVMSAKGGDGSTSLAVNMATALASDSTNRVLLIDLALPFGDADISAWGKTAEHDLADFCREVHRLDDALLGSMVAQIRPNLHFMPSPAEFDKVIGIEPDAMQQLMAFLATRYHHILVDVGSHVDPITLRVWEQLDRALVVCTATVPSLRRLKRLRQLWSGMGLDASHFQVVLNRMSSKPDMDLAAFERVCPGKPLRRLPVEIEGMRASVMRGEPLVELQPRSAYARSVTAWAAELSGRPQREKSLWQRLKKK